MNTLDDKMYINIPQLADHMIHECKHVRCVCSNDGSVYEVRLSNQ